MVGAVLISNSSFIDSHSCPCLCLYSLSSPSLKIKSNGELGVRKNLLGQKELWKKGSLDLSSTFIDTWYWPRLSGKRISSIVNSYSRKQRKIQKTFKVVDELGGQYEDTFNDVKLVRRTNLSNFSFSLYSWIFFLKHRRDGRGALSHFCHPGSISDKLQGGQQCTNEPTAELIFMNWNESFVNNVLRCLLHAK